MADQLEVPFYDLNEEVEKLLQRLPPDQVNEIGWDEINTVEKTVLADLITKKGAVIAANSDLVDDEESFNILKYSDTAIIYLHGRFTETVAKFIASQLFSSEKIEQWVTDIFQILWQVRDQEYRSIADLMVEIDGKEPEQVAREIAEFITMEVGEDDLF
ncbi:hypothetical protein KIMC2_17840 [Xylocopilactobacillus apis]|uniref:Shikimate kinase n=1 Tax=Xylocopilactobacillus apis TaxID=2932183 RepID=A0AAU9DK67_9LACO|nr:hypothetical protein KIMC2_17840 [Xylocopilactobacillus apis]